MRATCNMHAVVCQPHPNPNPNANANANQENIYRHPEGGGAGNNWAMGYDMAQSVQDGLTLTP